MSRDRRWRGDVPARDRPDAVAWRGICQSTHCWFRAPRPPRLPVARPWDPADRSRSIRPSGVRRTGAGRDLGAVEPERPHGELRVRERHRDSHPGVRIACHQRNGHALRVRRRRRRAEAGHEVDRVKVTDNNIGFVVTAGSDNQLHGNTATDNDLGFVVQAGRQPFEREHGLRQHHVLQPQRGHRQRADRQCRPRQRLWLPGRRRRHGAVPEHRHGEPVGCLRSRQRQRAQRQRRPATSQGILVQRGRRAISCFQRCGREHLRRSHR